MNAKRFYLVYFLKKYVHYFKSTMLVKSNPNTRWNEKLLLYTHTIFEQINTIKIYPHASYRIETMKNIFNENLHNDYVKEFMRIITMIGSYVRGKHSWCPVNARLSITIISHITVSASISVMQVPFWSNVLTIER